MDTLFSQFEEKIISIFYRKVSTSDNCYLGQSVYSGKYFQFHFFFHFVRNELIFNFNNINKEELRSTIDLYLCEIVLIYEV
jgi:hypothetical protein